MRPGPAALLAAATALACLSGCAAGRRSYAISADPSLLPRLEAILAASPPPESWSRVGTEAEADTVIELRVGEAPGLSLAAGRRYLAAAVLLNDSRYSVDADQARAIGLRPLEAIAAPYRALSVDGAWPGEGGYPFAESLRLSINDPRRKSSAYPRRSAMGRWLAEAAAAAELSSSAPCVLAAAGDFQAAERHARFLSGGGIGNLLRGDIVDRVRGADVAVLNLEGVVSSGGEPHPRKRFRFRMPPGTGAALAGAGFDVALLANNHAFDFGGDAFLDTLEELRGAGMPAVGAGRDADEASAPAVVKIPSYGRLSFFGFATYPEERLGFTTEEAAAGPSSPGINADESRTLDSIRAAAAAGDTVVVLAHGGIEYVAWTSPEIESRYARFAEAGAALVLGGHPHVTQGIAGVGSSLVAYSLGNFLFTGLEEPDLSVKSVLAEFLLYEGRARGFRIRPVIVGIEYTEPDPEISPAEIRFSSICSPTSRAE